MAAILYCLVGQIKWHRGPHLFEFDTYELNKNVKYIRLLQSIPEVLVQWQSWQHVTHWDLHVTVSSSSEHLVHLHFPSGSFAKVILSLADCCPDVWCCKSSKTVKIWNIKNTILSIWHFLMIQPAETNNEMQRSTLMSDISSKGCWGVEVLTVWWGKVKAKDKVDAHVHFFFFFFQIFLWLWSKWEQLDTPLFFRALKELIILLSQLEKAIIRKWRRYIYKKLLTTGFFS